MPGRLRGGATPARTYRYPWRYPGNRTMHVYGHFIEGSSHRPCGNNHLAGNDTVLADGVAICGPHERPAGGDGGPVFLTAWTRSRGECRVPSGSFVRLDRSSDWSLRLRLS